MGAGTRLLGEATAVAVLAPLMVLLPAPAPALAEPLPGPVVELTGATPGGTQAAQLLASDGTALLVGQGKKRLLLEGGSETELVPPASLVLPLNPRVQVNGQSVLLRSGKTFAWYDGSGHGTAGHQSTGALLGPVPGGWLVATHTGTVTRVQRVDGVTGTTTTVRDLAASAVTYPEDIDDAAVLRDRVVLLTQRSGRTVLVVVPLSGTAPTALTTTDTATTVNGLVATAAGYAWRSGDGVHARLAGGQQLHRPGAQSHFTVSAAGLVLVAGNDLVTVAPSGATTTWAGCCGRPMTLGTTLVVRLAEGQLAATTPGLHTVSAAGSATLLRPDPAAPLSARRVAVGATDVLWTDDADAGLYGVRARALDGVADAPVRTVSTASDASTVGTTVTSASGDEALVRRGSSVQLVQRQPDGTWVEQGSPFAGTLEAHVTPGWLASGGSSLTKRLTGTSTLVATGIGLGAAVESDHAWAVVPGSPHYLRSRDLVSGRVVDTALDKVDPYQVPRAASGLVAVAVRLPATGAVPQEHTTTLLRAREDGTVEAVATALPGRPVALTPRVLVTWRYQGRELLARDLLSGTTTTIADPYGIPVTSVSAADGVVGWVGGDGRPRVQRVLPAVGSVLYGGGAVLQRRDEGWTGTWPLTAPVASCSLAFASSAGDEHELPCLPAGSTATTAWDGKDGDGVDVPNGYYRWTLSGSGPVGQLETTHGFLRVFGTAGQTQQLSVTVEKNGPAAKGVVRSSWPGMDCSTGTCTGAFAPGAEITLTATASPGAHLGPWSGDCTADPCTVLLDIDRSVTKQLLDDAPTVLQVGGWGTTGDREYLASARFSELVTGAVAGLRLRNLATGALVPGSWCFDGLCGTGTTLLFFPTARHVAGTPYRVEVSTAVVDAAGQPAGPYTSPPVKGRSDSYFRDATPRWSRVVDSRALGGSYLHEQGPGATWRHAFSGTSQRLWFLTGSAGGRAGVWIDGTWAGTVEQYAPSRYRAYRTFSGLAPGAHTIAVKVLPTKHPRSTGTDVVVDALSTGAASCPVSTTGCVLSPVGAMTLALIDDGGWAGQGWRTMTRGSGVTWWFYGTGVQLHAQGYARYRVDGGALRDTAVSFGAPLKVSGLAKGLHKLEVVAAAPKDYAELLDVVSLVATG